MTVYVDDMYLYPMGEFKRGPRTYKMSHMIADTAKDCTMLGDEVDAAFFNEAATPSPSTEEAA